MKAYIINLRRSENRRKHITSEAEKAGLQYEIVEAVDGALLSDADLERLCNMDIVRQYPDWLSRGMIGASLSHRRVYEKIIKDQEKFALVVEDDAVFPVALKQILTGLERAMHESEVALLHYSCFEHLELSTHNAVHLTDSHRLLYPMSVRRLGGGVCYAIGQAAAQGMYEATARIEASPDTWPDFLRNGYFETIRCVYPMEIEHLGVKSDINATVQGTLRQRVTRFIDKHKLPILHQVLRGARQRSLHARQKFSTTGKRSPLDVDE